MRQPISDLKASFKQLFSVYFEEVRSQGDQATINLIRSTNYSFISLTIICLAKTQLPQTVCTNDSAEIIKDGWSPTTIRILINFMSSSSLYNEYKSQLPAAYKRSSSSSWQFSYPPGPNRCSPTESHVTIIMPLSAKCHAMGDASGTAATLPPDKNIIDTIAAARLEEVAEQYNWRSEIIVRCASPSREILRRGCRID